MIEFVLQKYIELSRETWQGSDTITGDVERAIYAERLALINQFIYDLRRLQKIEALLASLHEGGVLQ